MIRRLCACRRVGASRRPSLEQAVRSLMREMELESRGLSAISTGDEDRAAEGQRVTLRLWSAAE
jgi:glucose-6-phosphate-specific signal transduction histidine kinase